MGSAQKVVAVVVWPQQVAPQAQQARQQVAQERRRVI
jgi:hypothetical protein